jgi:hypothetical protein
MYFHKAGERAFNIKIGNKIVRQNLDVVELAGSKYAAHEEYIEIDVRQDGVYYESTKIPGAVSGGKLKLIFSKGKADNPIVQAIIVYQDSLESKSQIMIDSPQLEYQQLKLKWQTQKEIQRAMKEEAGLKELISVQKKKEKIVIRNDQLIVEKNNEQKKTVNQKSKFGPLRSTLMGPVGIIIWGFLFGFALKITAEKIFKISLKDIKSN